MKTDHELAIVACVVFDAARSALGAKNNTELAHQLGISHKTLSLLRSGRVTPVQAALLKALKVALQNAPKTLDNVTCT